MLLGMTSFLWEALHIQRPLICVVFPPEVIAPVQEPSLFSVSVQGPSWTGFGSK